MGALLAPVLSSATAWAESAACVGVAASAQAQFAQQVGGGLFLASLVLGLLGVGFVWRRGLERRVLAPLVLVVLAHPGAWMSAASAGDCGRQMMFAAVVFTLQAMAMLGWILARPRVIERMLAD